MNDDTIAIRSHSGEYTVRTKPCWICGQHSLIDMPAIAFSRMENMDIHPSIAWPQGTHEQHMLLINGIHQKCWDKEFPDTSY